MYVLCNRITSLAKMPTKTTGGCAPYSYESCELEPCQKILVNTGISFKFPDGYFGLILPSSFISLVKRLEVVLYVLNFDLRFEVCIQAYNNTNEKVRIEAGDRIARMIIFQESPCTLLAV